MARKMYGSHDFADVPVLADALEEAGGEEPDVLSHCRSGGGHFRAAGRGVLRRCRSMNNSSPIVWGITVAVCFLAAVAEVALAVASSTGLTLFDALIALFVVGPYLVTAWMAWMQRRRRVVSGLLLAAASLLAAWGMYVYGVDCYRYHTEPNYRMVQRMGIFMVPLCQWLVTLVLGSFLLGSWVGSRRSRAPATGTGWTDGTAPK
jgi:hypothetical protein